MPDISSHLELVENRIREYEKLVFQSEKIQTKVPDSCKVFIVRSLVPKDLEKGLAQNPLHCELQDEKRVHP